MRSISVILCSDTALAAAADHTIEPAAISTAPTGRALFNSMQAFLSPRPPPTPQLDSTVRRPALGPSCCPSPDDHQEPRPSGETGANRHVSTCLHGAEACPAADVAWTEDMRASRSVRDSHVGA